MQRFIKSMALGVTVLTVTVLSTTNSFADGKGGHSGGNHGTQQSSFKPNNATLGQGQHFVQNNQVTKLNQAAQNTLKQINLTQNFNHTNGSQFKKTGKDFTKSMYDKKFDYCHNYCHDFGWCKNWWGCWNYPCWNTYCYPYCGFYYPWLSYYPSCYRGCTFTLGYAVSPVFTTEVIVPEVVVPQLAVREAAIAGPAAVAPAGKPGLSQNAPMDTIETVDTGFITGSVAGNK
jgi:hypothetical protein